MSRPLRVLFVTNGLAYGGAERIVQALAIDLKAAGDGHPSTWWCS